MLLYHYSLVCLFLNSQAILQLIIDFGKKQDDIPIKNGKIDHSQKKLENKCCLITFIIFLLLFIIFFFYSVASQNLSQWTNPVDYTFVFTFPAHSFFNSVAHHAVNQADILMDPSMITLTTPICFIVIHTIPVMVGVLKLAPTFAARV